MENKIYSNLSMQKENRKIPADQLIKLPCQNMKIMIQKLIHGSVVNGFRIRSGLVFMDIFQGIRVNLRVSTPKNLTNKLYMSH